MGGSPLRNWQNINILMNFGPVAVFCLATLPQESHNISAPGVAIYSINRVSDSQPTIREKFQRRLLQMWWLLTRGHPYTGASSVCTSSLEKLNRILSEFQPHLVVFGEPWLYGYLPTVRRYSCRVILDAHNVESVLLRETQKAEAVKGFKASVELARVEAIERDFVRRVDWVWACSERDANLLEKISGGSNVRVVPNSVDVDYYDSVRLGHSTIPGGWQPSPWSIIFTASFSYGPNVLAAQLLLDEVYPRLRQIYPCRLLLVGVSPTQFMLTAAEKDPGILVTGKVPDIRPYLAAASVVVVPLLQGGGTRLKILEAFAAGRPVVSTAKGAEGLKVRDGEHLLLGNNAEALIAGVCRIWSEPLGQKLAQAAYELVKAEYSWEATGRNVQRIIAELL